MHLNLWPRKKNMLVSLLDITNICKPPQSWQLWQLWRKEEKNTPKSRNISFSLYLPSAFSVLLTLSSSSLPCVYVDFAVFGTIQDWVGELHIWGLFGRSPRECGEALHLKETVRAFWSAWHTVKHSWTYRRTHACCSADWSQTFLTISLANCPLFLLLVFSWNTLSLFDFTCQFDWNSSFIFGYV